MRIFVICWRNLVVGRGNMLKNWGGLERMFGLFMWLNWMCKRLNFL